MLERKCVHGMSLKADGDGDLYLLLSENIFISSGQVPQTIPWHSDRRLMDTYICPCIETECHRCFRVTNTTHSEPFQVQLKYLIRYLLVPSNQTDSLALSLRTQPQAEHLCSAHNNRPFNFEYDENQRRSAEHNHQV